MHKIIIYFIFYKFYQLRILNTYQNTKSKVGLEVQFSGRGLAQQEQGPSFGTWHLEKKEGGREEGRPVSRIKTKITKFYHHFIIELNLESWIKNTVLYIRFYFVCLLKVHLPFVSFHFPAECCSSCLSGMAVPDARGNDKEQSLATPSAHRLEQYSSIMIFSYALSLDILNILR